MRDLVRNSASEYGRPQDTKRDAPVKPFTWRGERSRFALRRPLVTVDNAQVVCDPLSSITRCISRFRNRITLQVLCRSYRGREGGAPLSPLFDDLTRCMRLDRFPGVLGMPACRRQHATGPSAPSGPGICSKETRAHRLPESACREWRAAGVCAPA